jgi:hypothetical protein
MNKHEVDINNLDTNELGDVDVEKLSRLGDFESGD